MRRAIILLVLLCACRTRLFDDAFADGSAPDSNAPDLSAPFDLAFPHDLARACDPASNVLGPATADSIACYASACSLGGGDVPGQVCCLVRTGPGGSCQFAVCPGGSFSVFECDGPEDCAGRGGSCCVTEANGLDHAQCSTSCGSQTVCHSTDECPVGLECDPRGDLPPGAGLCAVPACGP